MAAIRFLIPDAPGPLLRRTRAFVRSRPAPTRRVLEDYLRRGSGGRPSAWMAPYWMVLPRWLAAKFGAPAPRIVGDIVWGQYCLYAYVRMHDDVMDGQGASAGLVIAAETFLVEAERTCAAHVRDDAFWRFFRNSLEETAHGILEVDARQRRARYLFAACSPPTRGVAAIFKVGSAAICLPRRRKELERVGRCADHLAIAGQLLDDLEDVDEDSSNGRQNAAARLLLGRDTDRPIARAIVTAQGSETLLTMVEREVEKARIALAPLASPRARIPR